MTLAKRRCTWTILLVAVTMMTSWTSAQHPDRWPQFRGAGSRGLNSAQALPVQWDGESMANIAWKIRIPGLGLSSPVVWDGKVFLTSAVSHVDEPFLQVGLFGSTPENPEDYEHQYTVFCFDAKTGETLWEKVAITAVPKQQRHIKASHANCTLALDGKHVLAFFDSQGMYCYNMDGKLLWKKDLGLMDAGPYDATDLTWGFASSPVLYDNKVYLQCDTRNQKFIAAYNADTGEEVWKTPRTDEPTWSSPVIVQVAGRAQVVVNGWHRRAAYDALTGQEIWWMDGGGDVPTPTPFEAHDHLYFSSSHGRQRPLFAIKKTAQGNISLQGRETSNDHVTWANLRRGAYQPTPIVVGDLLYVVQDNGVLTAYDALTGTQVYRELAGGERGAYSASTVAADGRVYFNSEFGKIHVVEAGAEYKHLATNIMGDEIMATPAIAGKSMFIRTRRFLWAVRDQGDQVTVATKETTEPKVRPVKAFTPPANEQRDAKNILEIATEACSAIPTPQYTVHFYGTHALKPFLGDATFTYSAVGDHYRVEGQAMAPRTTEAVHFTVGYDSRRYWALDDSAKTVHADLEPGVMGPIAGLRRYFNLGKFGTDKPFESELTASNLIELRGTTSIDGVACYEVYVTYPGEGSRPDTWFIDKKTFLPRKYIEHHTMRDGSIGELVKDILTIIPEPQYPKGFFEIPSKAGYARTDKPLWQ